MCPVFAKNETDKNEFSITYGQITVPQAAYVLGGVFGAMFSLGHFSFEDAHFIGGVGVEYVHYVNDWLGIAAGLSYAQQGWKFEGLGNEETTKLDYLNIPLTGNFYVVKGLALKTGVQFGFLMNGKVEDTDIKDACEKLNLSIPIGVSYEISDFVIDFRYNLGLTKTNKEDNGNKVRSDLIQITLGYKIPL